MENTMELKGRFFPYWDDFDEMIYPMSDQDAGRMIKAMSAYYFRNVEPEALPPELKGLWFFVRKFIDDARKRYEQKVLSGQKGGERSAQVRRMKAEAKQKEALLSTSNQTQPIIITESIPNNNTITNTNTNTGKTPVGDVSVEKQSFGEFGWVKLTAEEYRKLEAQWGREELERCIAYVDESAQSTGNRNRWKDWGLILRKCYRDRWHEVKHHQYKEPVPMGATGHLGEAELEAIQRVLREDIPPVILPEEMNGGSSIFGYP